MDVRASTINHLMHLKEKKQQQIPREISSNYERSLRRFI